MKRITKIDKLETEPFTVEPEKRKNKYKSKILNSDNYPPDTFEVLQHRRNITQTSSIELCNDNSEESEDIKWSEFLPRLVQPDPEEIQMEKDKKLSHLVKEVTEGRIIKEKRVTIDVKEPPTLVSVSEVKTGTTKDPGFYNFFVDLLETTFSVYNLKSEFSNDKIPSAVSSKVAFEMDEEVANKLNAAPEPPRKPSTHVEYKEEPKKDELIDYFKNCPRRSNSPPPKRKKKSEYPPKRKTPKIEPRQSLLYPQSVLKRSSLLPQSASLTQNKPFYKKNSKQTLINLLKEQLRMDNQPLEEPQNLFKALQVLAKNKRKTQKSLRFEETSNELADCMYRSRRLVRRRNKQKNDPKIPASPTTRPDHQTRPDFKKWQKVSEDEESNHSLKVVNVQEYYGRLKKFKRDTNYPTSFSPTSYSPSSFSPSCSPVDSVQNIAFETNRVPIRSQVIMTDL